MLSQELEFGRAPDRARTTDDPFRAHATFRLTIPQCTPLGQRNPVVQMSAPIPLPAELALNQSSPALPNSSTSKESMPPQPKRVRSADSIAAPDAHGAAGDLPVVVPTRAEQPPTEDLHVSESMSLLMRLSSDLQLHVLRSGDRLAFLPTLVAMSSVSRHFRALTLPVLKIEWLSALKAVWASATDPADAMPTKGFPKSAFATCHNLESSRAMLSAVLPRECHGEIDGIIRGWGVHDLTTEGKDGGKIRCQAEAQAELDRIFDSSASHVLTTGWMWEQLLQMQLLTKYFDSGAKATAQYWAALGVRHTLSDQRQVGSRMLRLSHEGTHVVKVSVVAGATQAVAPDQPSRCPRHIDCTRGPRHAGACSLLPRLPEMEGGTLQRQLIFANIPHLTATISPGAHEAHISDNNARALRRLLLCEVAPERSTIDGYDEGVLHCEIVVYR